MWQGLHNRFTLRFTPGLTRGRTRGTAAARALAAALILVAAPLPCGHTAFAAGAPPRLKQYKSRRYTVHTNLPRTDAVVYGEHMDAVVDEYERRFAHMRPKRQAAMSLYLFRTQQQFLDFLRSHGLPAEHTSGMFFVQPDIRGLATWTQDKSRSTTIAVLQHEGFHQFAHQYLGPGLPVWVNEGLAQYFEDGILLKGEMKLGLANSRRIKSVQWALTHGRAVGFEQLLTMTDEEWKSIVLGGKDTAGLLYAQSWSMVYFLIHGDGGRYRRAFDRYLELVASGVSGDDAFARAFENDSTEHFRKRWTQFARTVKPDALNTALERMKFLGEGLRVIHQRRMETPRSLKQLRRSLQRVRFHTVRRSHSVEIKTHATDESVYRYRLPNGAVERFQMLEAGGFDLPPRLTARGLRPQPTLIWLRDGEGKLTHAFEYR